MWRYDKGVTQPSKKRKVDQVDTVYEATKRARTWQPKWLQDRTWLVYDGNKNQMHCHVCRSHSTLEQTSQRTFIEGNNHFKLESIKCHERSVAHVLCMRQATSLVLPEGTSIAKRTLRTLNETQLERMTKLFRTAHSLVIHGRPFTDFRWMCR